MGMEGWPRLRNAHMGSVRGRRDKCILTHEIVGSRLMCLSAVARGGAERGAARSCVQTIGGRGGDLQLWRG